MTVKKWFVGTFILALFGMLVGVCIGCVNIESISVTNSFMDNYTTVGTNHQFEGFDKVLITWANNGLLAIIFLFIAAFLSRYISPILLFIQMILLGILFSGHILTTGVIPVLAYILPHGLTIELGVYSYLISIGAYIDKRCNVTSADELYIVQRIKTITSVIKNDIDVNKIILALILLGFAAYIEVYISPEIFMMVVL